MKKVITGDELFECELKAIELLCGTVKKTLGPKGCNAIIDHSLFSPFITNDGVTIAKNIESEDARINTILTIAKEASIKTDETIGDGTTTTLVLLESFFKYGLNKIKEGLNPQLLKKELDAGVEELITKIKKESKVPKKEDYLNVASIAANDYNIGKLISEIYLKLNIKGALKIEESKTDETYSKIINGYNFDALLASPYFLNNKNEEIYQNSFFLIVNKNINDIEEISELLNFFIANKSPAVIIANDYNEEVINEILSLNFNGVTNVTLLKTPDYGTHQIAILNDLETISKCKIANNSDVITLSNLGKCDKVIINKEEIIIYNNTLSEKLNKLIKDLKNKIAKEQDDYEKDFLNSRLAKLTCGKAIIYVGASTNTEAREKKMRFDDALCALESLEEGILPGGGIVLLKLKEELTAKNNGYEILKETLDKPFIQIMDNVGQEYRKIYNKIKENNYNILYNAVEEKFEDVSNTIVIDPTAVVIKALLNASSIAGMLLTTSSLIINEYKEKINYNINEEI